MLHESEAFLFRIGSAFPVRHPATMVEYKFAFASFWGRTDGTVPKPGRAASAAHNMAAIGVWGNTEHDMRRVAHVPAVSDGLRSPFTDILR